MGVVGSFRYRNRPDIDNQSPILLLAQRVDMVFSNFNEPMGAYEVGVESVYRA